MTRGSALTQLTVPVRLCTLCVQSLAVVLRAAHRDGTQLPQLVHPDIQRRANVRELLRGPCERPMER